MSTNYVLSSTPEWTAIYRCLKHETQEVIVNSIDEPEPVRVFRVPHVGRAKFVAVSKTRLNTPNPKEGKVARKRKTKKEEEPEVEETEDDDLEDLEELEDDLEDLEEEEPDDEDDDDEDEDEESDEPSMDDTLKDLRARAKAAGLSAAKAKSAKGDKGKKALIKYITAHEGDDEDEEEEEEETKPKKKKGKKGQAPPTRELPKGRYGPNDIADLCGKDARAVRIWLRKNEEDYPKDEELGRYSFTKKQAEAISKKIKKGARDSD